MTLENRRARLAAMKPCSLGLVVFAIALGQLGCRSPRRDEPLVGPLQIADERIARGEKVFATHCHQCHPGGAAGLAPAINDKPIPSWLLKTQVRIGLGAMPGFAPHEISDEDRTALAAYVKSLRRHR